MHMWAIDNDILQSNLKENRYTSHQVVNKMIEILGLTVLRALLSKIKGVTGPRWFSIIAGEVTDTCNTEQLNLYIRWVSNDYVVNEDPLGLCRVPNTKAETLFRVITDLLIRCDFPLGLCRGQPYNGAAKCREAEPE